MNHEKARKPGGPAGAKIETGDTFSMPHHAKAVNTGNPRLWRTLRKLNQNFKTIIRLREENVALLEEMYRLQGVAR